MFRSSPATATLSAATSAVKRLDALLAGPIRQLGQQFGAQPPALPVIDDGDGDVGGLWVLGVPDVAGDAHPAPVAVI